MERETGIEPATFSLGIPVSIENKQHRAQRSPFQFTDSRPLKESPTHQTLNGLQTDYDERLGPEGVFRVGRWSL